MKKPALVLLLVAALVVAGCGGGDSTDSTSTQTNAQTPIGTMPPQIGRPLHAARVAWQKGEKSYLETDLVRAARAYVAVNPPTRQLPKVGPKAEYERDLARGLVLLARTSLARGETKAARAQLRAVRSTTATYEQLRREGE
jgi:hypothetical protein